MFSYYKNFYGKGVVCPICWNEMVLDDVDYNFEGNQNEYWICNKCDSSGYVKVRYGKPISKELMDKDGKSIRIRVPHN